MFTAVVLVLAACGGVQTEGTTTNDEEAATSDATATSTEATTTSTEATTPDATTSTFGTSTTPDETFDPVGDAQTDAVVTDGFPGTGETAFLTEVEITAHDGFERIVFEFDQASPEYRIEYIEGPVIESPSGNEIEVSGETYLSIAVSPATGVDPSGDEPRETYQGPDRLVPEGTSAVMEVVETENFENVLGWVIGLDETRPFGSALLESPSRLLIDIRTE